MKKNTHLTLILLHFVCFIQAQNEAWTKWYNYSAQTGANNMAIDLNGNLFVVGEFGLICYGAACKVVKKVILN